MTDRTDRERIEILERELVEIVTRLNEMERELGRLKAAGESEDQEFMEEIVNDQGRIRLVERQAGKRDEAEAFATDWS